MVDVIFKNVGAGDSIIITVSGEEEKLGIIDCKKHNGGNPVLEYIKGQKVSLIDFIILSHPHQDHYSGFIELLDYIEDLNIQVKLFMFSTTDHPAILESIVSVQERRQLTKLYNKVRKLNQMGLIKYRNRTEHGHKISLSNSYFLKILSPSFEEQDDYKKTLLDSNLKVRYSSNPNIVSTVISIESETGYILFTSDAEKKTLRRVGLTHLNKKFKKKLFLGQIPHHGSEKNHKKDFWRTKIYDKKTPLAISVGKNGDGHPSQVVIDELNSIDYKVELTWGSPTKSHRRSKMLGTHSSPVNVPKTYSKDLIYQNII